MGSYPCEQVVRDQPALVSVQPGRLYVHQLASGGTAAGAIRQTGCGDWYYFDPTAERAKDPGGRLLAPAGKTDQWKYGK